MAASAAQWLGIVGAEVQPLLHCLRWPAGGMPAAAAAQPESKAQHEGAASMHQLQGSCEEVTGVEQGSIS